MMHEDNEAAMKLVKKRTKPKPNQGINLDEEKRRLNAALDRLGLRRGGHRGMYHGGHGLKK